MSAMAEPNIDVVIDGHTIELLLDFWAAALGYRKIGAKDQYGLLLPDNPAHPPVILQRVPEPKTSKTRTSTYASTTSRPKRRSSRRTEHNGSTSDSPPPRSSPWPTRKATSSASARRPTDLG